MQTKMWIKWTKNRDLGQNLGMTMDMKLYLVRYVSTATNKCDHLLKCKADSYWDKNTLTLVG